MHQGAHDTDPLMADPADVAEVQHVYLITGRHDLIVKVAARDVDHLKSLPDQKSDEPRSNEPL